MIDNTFNEILMFTQPEIAKNKFKTPKITEKRWTKYQHLSTVLVLWQASSKLST